MPKKHQHVIRQAMAGTEGVANVTDYLICCGKTVLEHNQILHKLLAMLKEKNLTLNSEKCTLRMNKNNSLYGNSPFSTWCWTYGGESASHEGGQSSNYTFRSEELSWVGWIQLQVYSRLCHYCRAPKSTYQEWSQV